MSNENEPLISQDSLWAFVFGTSLNDLEREVISREANVQGSPIAARLQSIRQGLENPLAIPPDILAEAFQKPESSESYALDPTTYFKQMLQDAASGDQEAQERVEITIAQQLRLISLLGQITGETQGSRRGGNIQPSQFTAQLGRSLLGDENDRQVELQFLYSLASVIRRSARDTAVRWQKIASQESPDNDDTAELNITVTSENTIRLDAALEDTVVDQEQAKRSIVREEALREMERQGDVADVRYYCLSRFLDQSTVKISELVGLEATAVEDSLALSSAFVKHRLSELEN